MTVRLLTPHKTLAVVIEIKLNTNVSVDVSFGVVAPTTLGDCRNTSVKFILRAKGAFIVFRDTEREREKTKSDNEHARIL